MTRVRGVLLVAVLAVIAAGAVALASRRGPSTSARGAPPDALPLAQLGAARFTGWQALDAPGRVGRFEAFDPVANLDWARQVGVAWKPDAVLHRVDVSRVARDGTVDLTTNPDASVDYWMVSPACLTDFKRVATGVDPRGPCELRLSLGPTPGQGPAVRVLVGSTMAAPPPLGGLACTLTRAMASLETAGRLPDRAGFDVTLSMHAGPRRPGRDRGGDVAPAPGPYPTWYVRDPGSGEASLGTLDADSCALLY